MPFISMRFLMTLVVSFFLLTWECGPVWAGEETVSQPDYTAVIKDLTDYIHHGMGEDHVKGLSLALVDGDRVVWQEGFGWADEVNRVPATADTLYRMDSVSKILTAVE